MSTILTGSDTIYERFLKYFFERPVADLIRDYNSPWKLKEKKKGREGQGLKAMTKFMGWIVTIMWTTSSSNILLSI